MLTLIGAAVHEAREETSFTKRTTKNSRKTLRNKVRTWWRCFPEVETAAAVAAQREK